VSKLKQVRCADRDATCDADGTVPATRSSALPRAVFSFLPIRSLIVGEPEGYTAFSLFPHLLL
jgi:hypothetical protein